jgi:CBS domain
MRVCDVERQRVSSLKKTNCFDDQRVAPRFRWYDPSMVREPLALFFRDRRGFVLMIFETTQDYAVIVPLMISTLVSFFISARLQREPIYDALARQDGIHLPSAATRQQRGGRQVAQVMRRPVETLPAVMSISDALQLALTSQYRCWPVCDDRGVIGVLNKRKPERAAAEHGAAKAISDLEGL